MLIKIMSFRPEEEILLCLSDDKDFSLPSNDKYTNTTNL